MAKGIIYIMETAVPGLIKIGKTGKDNFNSRMYNLERNGYCNVTALKRVFAIEVDNYDEKEILLQTIFEKSRVAETELFALDKNLAIQLLSSFDGNIIYPEEESKAKAFDEATDNTDMKKIPDGNYYFRRNKKSENKEISATAHIENGEWTLLKGSVLATTEFENLTKSVKAKRATLNTDSYGNLLKETPLGQCSPSFVGSLVLGGPLNGWTSWTNEQGQTIDVYRKSKK